MRSRSPATGWRSGSIRGPSGSPPFPGSAAGAADARRRSSRSSPIAASRRFVLAHGGGAPDLALLGAARRPRSTSTCSSPAASTDLDGIRRLRDAGIAGIILGEALLSGAIDFTAALEAAA